MAKAKSSLERLKSRVEKTSSRTTKKDVFKGKNVFNIDMYKDLKFYSPNEDGKNKINIMIIPFLMSLSIF
jgi:hypothetical protein